MLKIKKTGSLGVRFAKKKEIIDIGQHRPMGMHRESNKSCIRDILIMSIVQTTFQYLFDFQLDTESLSKFVIFYLKIAYNYFLLASVSVKLCIGFNIKKK